MLSYHHISCHHIFFSKFLTSIAVVEWVFPWFPTKNKHVPHEFSHEHCHSPLIFAWVSHDLPMIAIARDQLKPLKRCCSAAHPRTSRSPDVATPPWRSDGKNASTNGSKSMGKDGKSNINHGKTMGKTWEILIPTSHASHHPQTGSPPSMAMTKRNRFELELPIPYKEFDLIWGRFDLIWGRVCVNICRANLVFHYHISMVSPHYVTVVVVVVV